MDRRSGKCGNGSASLKEAFEPWELEGHARRDCLPHRAGLLLWMARVSLLAGGLSFACPMFSLFGFPMGVAARVLARRDLDSICAGRMDHRGYSQTGKARSDSHVAMVVNLLGPLLWLVWLVAAVVYLFAGARGFLLG